MLTNAGGAIAVLGFMGSSDVVRAMHGPRYALGFFLSGIVLTGILIARGIHYMSRLFHGWLSDTAKYYSDEVGWNEIIESDKTRAETNIVVYFMGYTAFLCFIIGSVIGFLKLWAF